MLLLGFCSRGGGWAKLQIRYIEGGRPVQQSLYIYIYIYIYTSFIMMVTEIPRGVWGGGGGGANDPFPQMHPWCIYPGSDSHNAEYTCVVVSYHMSFVKTSCWVVCICLFTTRVRMLRSLFV